MSQRPSKERLLAQAKEEEETYDWPAAAGVYESAFCQALDSEDFAEAGEFQERIGHCLYRGAFQTQTQEQFKQCMLKAVEAYERAHTFYEKLSGEQEIARMLRCRAVAKNLELWLTSDPSEKRKLLDECLELEGKTLACFSDSGDMWEYGRTYNELGLVPWLRAHLAWNKHTKKSIIEKGLNWGEKAVAALCQLGDSHELARAYHTLATFLDSIRVFIADPEDQDRNHLKMFQCLSKAIGISEEVGEDYLLGKAHQLMGYQLEATEKSVMHCEKALECGKRTRDNFLIAECLQTLAYWSSLKSKDEEDSERWREHRAKALQLYDKAQRHYSIISFLPPIVGLMGPPSGHVEHYLVLAEWETDAEKRLEFLEQAEKAGMKALKLAEDSEQPLNIHYSLACLAQTLANQSLMESDLTEKRRLLKKALRFQERGTEIYDELAPFFYENRGVKQCRLANMKMQLADTEADSETKKRVLNEAVIHMERGLQLYKKMLPIYERRCIMTPFAWLRRDQDICATILTRLYDLTQNAKHLRNAIEISQQAIDSAKKLDLVSLIAESYWKIAKARDILGERLKAAENFERASESYLRAAEKIPQLKDFYTEYASYMDAWAELEKSRHDHETEEYAGSREHYQKGARHLELTKKWSYLSSYYAAWALLEHGEELSRLDQPQDAMKAFDEAMQTFRHAVSSLRMNGRRLESSEEREEASELAVLAGLRKQYCRGRVLMEEAKLSNRKGGKTSSAEKYASAAQTFEELAPNFQRKEARKELQFAATLCQAWQMMELAEGRRDAVLYGKAAGLFAKAGEITSKKMAGLMAVGNSCFCRALELGMQFMATSNMDSYSSAKLRMENAASYYRRAGCETAALWVEAVKRLLDAHVYVGRAEAEAEPEKRVRFYRMAEKCLMLSAKLHGKAGYPDRRKEVLRSLERVRKEHTLALSLREVLMAPAVLSSTTGVSMPNSTETAAGLNDFEGVNIRGRLSVAEEFVPGEEFQVKLDVVNVGTKPGLLVRVEGLAPQRCKVLRIPSSCALEDDSLNLRGRRLSPLSVESISIRVQVSGLTGINLSPRVVYVDEVGNFKTARVGGAKILPIVEFESNVAHAVFGYLVDAFVEDSMKARLSVERSGWRSFPQIMKGGGVSKRSLYGAGGHLGYGLSELRRKGLVDVKTFRGRGRGGHILRVRIHHKKAVVRRYFKEKAPDLFT